MAAGNCADCQSAMCVNDRPLLPERLDTARGKLIGLHRWTDQCRRPSANAALPRA
jgi:hypothetical protein